MSNELEREKFRTLFFTLVFFNSSSFYTVLTRWYLVGEESIDAYRVPGGL